MPITQKLILGRFTTNLAQIVISPLTFDTDHKNTFKFDIFSLFLAYNSKSESQPFFNRFGSNFHQPLNF